MMSDPFGVAKKHEEIRERIERGEPRLAQATINRQLVSYELSKNRISKIYGNVPANDDTTGKLIMSVARKKGQATAEVFDRAKIDLMIRDRKAHSSDFKNEHAEAALLAELLDERPELFR